MKEHPWKVLVVDDDEGIHSITRMVFRGYEFENRPIQLINANSSLQAKEILAEQQDIAVTLLDVVMETDNAGLDLVDHIRENLKNKDIRIILRTGHPGFAPEAQVIIDYDINDYLSKAELSASRLLTSVIVALRSYNDIINAKPVATSESAAGNTVADTEDKQRSLEAFSQHLHEKLQPLLETSRKLKKFSHKPMVNDLIMQLENHCEHLSAANLLAQPTMAGSRSTLELTEQISHLVQRYLPQAKQQNWIIDYEISPQLPRQIKLDHHWFQTLLMTLLEIAICRADSRSATEFFIRLTPTEQEHSILNLTITGRPNSTTAVSHWQKILLTKIQQLSNSAEGQPLGAMTVDYKNPHQEHQTLISYVINRAP